jgi:hypothetical protein
MELNELQLEKINLTIKKPINIDKHSLNISFILYIIYI